MLPRRSETDHVVAYVLDSNFMEFVGAHRGLFPAYFLKRASYRSSARELR